MGQRPSARRPADRPAPEQATPPNGPDWGIRINIVALFPTGERAG
ncbi:hypothetical protein [Caulobacter sp. 17J65-9]|nr:hypothetical protein [Caulobacter sp. 17J65-9]